MKNKILIFVVFILTVVLIFEVNIKKEEDTKIKVNKNDSVENLKLDEYIIGVVAAEMPASFFDEALKAQAVASRTYAMYMMNNKKYNDYDILASTDDQAYISVEEMKEKWNTDFDLYYSKIKDAVYSTKDEVMKYNNEIIKSFYFSMSNGKTCDSEIVFNEELAYIKSVESPWDNNTVNNFEVTNKVSKNDFCDYLNIGCENINITAIKRDETNRVLSIIINNKEFSGTEFRKLLNIRSTDFDIELNDNIYITTRGYGHGVGMSQYGANGMAKDGFNYKEILKYYYNDITIEKI